ncbi:MAG TPA: OsmC family peroxiredoxin [Nitriliruptorales bacterium]|nr:OsmC family peroxiredoxin [Nitriliruptorales bacterium]
MPTRTAEARWEGTLEQGKGSMRLPSQGYEGPFTHGSRFAEEEGSNPEEMVAAAHAGCFSQYLAALLSEAGYEPNAISTTANVTIEQVEGAPTITRIDLTTEADVPQLADDEFQQKLEQSKVECPVSKALSNVGEITATGTLRAS